MMEYLFTSFIFALGTFFGLAMFLGVVAAITYRREIMQRFKGKVFIDFPHEVPGFVSTVDLAERIKDPLKREEALKYINEHGEPEDLKRCRERINQILKEESV
jgi:hypothetical protein